MNNRLVGSPPPRSPFLVSLSTISVIIIFPRKTTYHNLDIASKLSRVKWSCWLVGMVASRPVTCRPLHKWKDKQWSALSLHFRHQTKHLLNKNFFDLSPFLYWQAHLNYNFRSFYDFSGLITVKIVHALIIILNTSMFSLYLFIMFNVSHMLLVFKHICFYKVSFDDNKCYVS